METNNDERILDLKKSIAEKKKLIGINSKFIPITNCILKMSDSTYNINVLSEVELIFILAYLDAYANTIKTYNLEDYDIISGFKVEEWKADILARIRLQKTKSETQNLLVMETKLDQLLSSQKKTEMELNDIEKLLK